jgi:hypothetical protein
MDHRTGTKRKFAEVGPAGPQGIPGGGSSVSYPASGAILAGQPVSFVRDGTTGVVGVKTITDSTEGMFAGISQLAHSDGETVDLMRHGVADTRFNRTAALLQGNTADITLTADTSNYIYATTAGGAIDGSFITSAFMNREFRFTDSGGVPADYSSNEDHFMVFYGGYDSTWELVLDDEFSFEHTAYTLHDRLGIRSWNVVSQLWEPIAVPWMVSTNGPTSGSKVSSPAGGGNFLPTSHTVAATSNGGVSVLGQPITINSMALRFDFNSDGSVQKYGWNMRLKNSDVDSAPFLAVTPETPLYLDQTDYTQLTDVSGGRLVGYSLGDHGVEAQSLQIKCYIE